MLESVIRPLYLLISLSICTSVLANTGVFNGSGSRVMPIKDSRIQLKEEAVNITISIPAQSAKWGLPFLPKANISANFHLDNALNTPVPLQLGFPFLSTQGFGNDDELIKNLNFQVISNGVHKDTVLKQGIIEKSLDPNGLFNKVITWEDTFEPLAQKDLKVTYDLPLSFAGMNLEKKLSAHGASYSFTYITKTAYTWRQPLNKAVFTISFYPIIDKLNTYLREHLPEEMVADVGPIPPLVYLQYYDEGDYTDHTLSIKYKDQIPVEAIYFEINIVWLPAKFNDIEKFIQNLPDHYSKVTKNFYKKEPYDEKQLLGNILQFYKGLYSGKVSPDLLHNVDNTTVEKTLKEQVPTVHFLLEGDREEVRKIIDYIENKLNTQKQIDSALDSMQLAWM
jgi:hypothetical protein